MKGPETSAQARGKAQKQPSLGSLLAALRRGLSSGKHLPPGLILLEDPWQLEETLRQWQSSLSSGGKTDSDS